MVSINTLEASKDFHQTGVIPAEDLQYLEIIEGRVAVLRKQLLPELICIIAALAMAFVTLGPELVMDTGMQTWHTTYAAGQ